MKEFKGVWIPYEIIKDIKLNDKEKIPYNLNWLKDSIEKLIKDYVKTIDFESYYFHKKYYFAIKFCYYL